MPRSRPTLRERFDAQWIPEPNSGCWLWLGSLNQHGYGRIMANGRITGAHRVAFEIYKRPIPPGRDRFVCHRCDVPACVNPDHLYLGDAGTNANDRSKRARYPAEVTRWKARKAWSAYRAKLTRPRWIDPFSSDLPPPMPNGSHPSRRRPRVWVQGRGWRLAERRFQSIALEDDTPSAAE